ncbi:MAG TPA: hypothetical protein VEI57_18950 [Nitrospirota bacterium]|nr:hypothetical protein [Nitrospirota bacterium]
MLEDTVAVCVILRNFESDSEYLLFEERKSNSPFGHFWIEKLSEQDKKEMCNDLKSFGMHWADNYYVAPWYYIGRGKSTTVLRDNMLMFFYPLFRSMKLYRTGV